MKTLAKAQKNPQFQFVQADIADRKAIAELFETEKPEIFLQTNAMGMSVLPEI